MKNVDVVVYNAINNNTIIVGSSFITAVTISRILS